MQKKKGFTLIELLAVIVILAIILIIAVPAIGNIIETARQKSFNISENMMKSAAMNYITQQRKELPTNIDDQIEITYEELKTTSYIENIRDPKSKTECTDSSITVRKISETNYLYIPNIVCDNYQSDLGIPTFLESSDILVEATETYLTDTSGFPSLGNSVEVFYTDLKTEGYLTEIVDPDTEEEALDSSKVKVINNSGTYTYKSGLVTENYIKLESHNAIINNDFSDGTTGWSATTCTISSSDNILTVTGNGTGNLPRAAYNSQIVTSTGKKIYYNITMRVTNTESSQLTIIFSSTSGWNWDEGINENPINENEWYTMSGIQTLNSNYSGNLIGIYSHGYADAASSNGMQMEIDGTTTTGVMLLDLTTIYGTGNEPTITEMNTILSNSGY